MESSKFCSFFIARSIPFPTPSCKSTRLQPIRRPHSGIHSRHIVDSSSSPIYSLDTFIGLCNVQEMSRWFSHSLTLTPRLPPKSSPLLLLRRTQSSHSSRRDSNLTDQPDSASSSADPLLRKLEDAIYRIIVQRSAPDWLPFVPGASYWVPPPRSRPFGVAQLLEKLTNPMSAEESLSTTNIRGWPSSVYFFEGTSSHPVEDESISSKASNDEDEEG